MHNPEAEESLPLGAALAETHDPELEASILGALVRNPKPEVMATAIQKLRDVDFYQPLNQEIWQAIHHLWSEGTPIDPNSVRIKVTAGNPTVASRATMHIIDIATKAIVPASMGWHIEQLQSLTVRRTASRAALKLHAATSKPDTDTFEELATFMADIQNLSKPTESATHLATVIDEVIQEVDDIGAGRVVPGINTGLADLDRVHCGMRPGQMIVIGARPGVGKTMLALAIARHNSIKENHLVHFVSLEMSRQELTYRILSAEANVPLAHLREGTVDDAHWRKIAQAHTKITNSRMVITDTGAQTIAGIHAASKAMLADGLKLVVIDYLQLVATSRKDGNRYSEVTEISRSIKMMAKDLQVPVIVLSQLSRRSENSGQERLPGLADLRDSSAIESDADAVWLLHKADEQQDPAAIGELSLVVAKNRNGSTAVLTLANRAHCADVAMLSTRGPEGQESTP